MTEAKQIQWYHSFDFGDGEMVTGRRPLSGLRRDSETIFSEPVLGKSFLDIGAWDGYFSFEAERRGARDVLATDHFCWSGPGWGTKSGFDYAHKKFGSKVRSLDIDPFDLDPEKIGIFDFVLFSGVLYHVKNPLGALEQVFKVTGEVAVVETEVDELQNPNAVLRFYLGRELNNDPTNYFAPNYKGLENMLREVGFKAFKFTPSQFPPGVIRGRTCVHAWK